MPSVRVTLLGKPIIVHGVFSKTDCEELIASAEGQGLEEALVNFGGGRQQKVTDVRDSGRCIIDDPATAGENVHLATRVGQTATAIFQTKGGSAIGLFFHPRQSDWTPVGANERLRILKYGPGKYFKPHFDGTYVRGLEVGTDHLGKTSFVTLQLYLNEGCRGGETTFLNDDCTQVSSVVPKQGSVLLFQHNLLHQGSTVQSGLKYVVRTDAMYTMRGAGHEYGTKPVVLKSASDSFETMEE